MKTVGFNQLTEAQAERLACLIEECSEVQKEACKILRHGYQSVNPLDPQVNNRDLLAWEMGDLLNTIWWLVETKDVNPKLVDTAVQNKTHRRRVWLHAPENQEHGK